MKKLFFFLYVVFALTSLVSAEEKNTLAVLYFENKKSGLAGFFVIKFPYFRYSGLIAWICNSTNNPLSDRPENRQTGWAISGAPVIGCAM